MVPIAAAKWLQILSDANYHGFWTLSLFQEQTAPTSMVRKETQANPTETMHDYRQIFKKNIKSPCICMVCSAQ